MRILSTVCSVFLLGTSLFSGTSFAMDSTASEEMPRESKRPVHNLRTIHSYGGGASLTRDLLSGLQDCDSLEIRVEGEALSRVVGGRESPDPSDDAAMLENFLADLGKPRDYRHAAYDVSNTVEDIIRAGHTQFPRLRHLKLTGTTRYVEDIEKQRGPMAVALLKVLSLCPNVEDLTLQFLSMDGRGVGALQAAGRLSSVKSLGITSAKMDDDAVARLLSSPFPALEYLDLTHNKEVTGASFSRASLPALRVLNLWGNEVNNAGLQAIASSQIPLLQTLALVGGKVDAEGLRGAQWGDKRIEMLFLDCHPIKDAGAHVLADPNYLPHLKVLSLGFTEITMSGLQALGGRSSTKLIDVRSAHITDTERQQLRFRNLRFGGIRSQYDGRIRSIEDIGSDYQIKF